jgi:trehalose-phosphatase
MLDYDGTLAPFRRERLRAYPYPGVPERLARLATTRAVRLVLVSGRPARELRNLLSYIPGFSEHVEIWGNHGQERLRGDGSYWVHELSETERKCVESVQREITRLGFFDALERKPASLAIHWRGFTSQEKKRIRLAIETVHLPEASDSNLRLVDFDGGVELRSRDAGKGDAVNQILAEEQADVPAAYLGDDLTDEEAFSASGRRVLPVLVRSEPRESAARFWLKPPEELLHFLDTWIRATGSRGDSA